MRLRARRGVGRRLRRRWIPVDVPGDVHTALVEAGRIEHPFYDRNEDDCTWMEEREWWYRASFDDPGPAPGERLRLVFHGLDTYATVFLNGEELGRHANMFREASFDVTELVRGENTLAIRFDPPLQHAGERDPEQWSSTPAERVWMRKAQYGFGWDWGPRLPTIGIWRPVELRRERIATLTRVNFSTLAIGRDALVAVDVEAECFAGDCRLVASIELRPPGGGEPARATVTLRDGAATAYLALDDPPLWWTHDLGEPALHDLRVTLSSGDEDVDVRERRVGVRTLELDQRPDPDEPGTRFFRFVLNGVGIFARGANWIPADSFVGALESARYERLIEDAVGANMNMLRVWGGGIYEHDVFYDECDRRGLLVWQDFMFSCATYPEEALAEEVDARGARAGRAARRASVPRAVVRQQREPVDPRHAVPRPRRRPRAGRAVLRRDPPARRAPSSTRARRTGRARRSAAATTTRARRATPTTGRSGTVRGAGASATPVSNGPTPERVAFAHYAEDEGRFISEFGVLAAPDRETLRRWIPADQLSHHSAAMDHHTKDNPKNKIDMLLESVTGVAGRPRRVRRLLDDRPGRGAEVRHRALPPPRAALLGHAGVAAQRLLAGAELGAARLPRLRQGGLLRGQARVRAGARLVQGRQRAVGDERHRRARRGRRAGAAGPVRRRGALRGAGARSRSIRTRAAAWRASSSRARPTATCRCARTRSRPTATSSRRSRTSRASRRGSSTTFEDCGRELRVRLRADAYAYFVHLAHPDERVRFSDNYLELEPGEERTVVLTHPEAAPRPRT